MSSEKKNRDMKECDKKEKKRKEKRGEEINTSKVREVKYLNLDLNLLWKDLGMKFKKIIRCLYFQISKRKGYVLWELWAFEDFVSDLVFWSYLLYLSIFGYVALGSYRS